MSSHADEAPLDADAGSLDPEALRQLSKKFNYKILNANDQPGGSWQLDQHVDSRNIGRHVSERAARQRMQKL
jgi:hypothetical protein